ncbi:MAG: class II aldolase/adducin family protein, partial [Bacteroidota bacterium]|nr:class II aldolase/adducin family protein [Bacteroidota bacterium]
MQENGYIKFDCKWQQTPPVIPGHIFKKLNPWRNNLYDLNLIGVYENGIGFGNISVSLNNTNSFYISGSATGAIKETGTEHYAFVQSFNLNKNLVNCTGPVKASSESLTHGAIYASAPRITGIIHIHHKGMWEWALDRFPTSGKEWAFGTPEIAIEISRLLRDPEIIETGIIVMGGHESGL